MGWCGIGDRRLFFDNEIKCASMKNKMIRKIEMLLLLVVCAGSLAAQGTLLSGAQRTAVMQKITTVSSHIRSIRCDFTQSKQSPMLADATVSEGIMRYSSPKMLRWEYTNPYKYIMVISGDTMYSEKNGKRLPQKNNRMMKGISSMVMNSIAGTKLFDEKSFKIELYDDNGTYRANMLPLRKDMKRMMKRIELRFSKNTCYIAAINITENDNSVTIIKFKNVVVK
jgi:outer membrane lipoprotein-sorting protein